MHCTLCEWMCVISYSMHCYHEVHAVCFCLLGFWQTWFCLNLSCSWLWDFEHQLLMFSWFLFQVLQFPCVVVIWYACHHWCNDISMYAVGDLVYGFLLWSMSWFFLLIQHSIHHCFEWYKYVYCLGSCILVFGFGFTLSNDWISWSRWSWNLILLIVFLSNYPCMFILAPLGERLVMLTLILGIFWCTFFFSGL